jgi:hypothetical protein
MRPPCADYSMSPARYAKGMLAVRCPSTTGYKTRAARLANALATRYTNREHAYILSPNKADRFERLYAEGWDACVITGELEAPRAAA